MKPSKRVIQKFLADIANMRPPTLQKLSCEVEPAAGNKKPHTYVLTVEGYGDDDTVTGLTVEQAVSLLRLLYRTNRSAYLIGWNDGRGEQQRSVSQLVWELIDPKWVNRNALQELLDLAKAAQVKDVDKRSK